MGKGRNPFVGNPFLDSFWLEAIGLLGITKPQTCGTAQIDLMTRPPLRCDDYFNKNWRTSTPAPAPKLTVNGELWMSLTPMEIQAAELSIRRAHGVVWTAGLGLGYFPIRCAMKSSVKQVNVVEVSEDVITLFKRMHKKKEWMSKINIIHGDAHKIIKGQVGDLCWMDTYQTLHSDDVIKDGKFYRKNNAFKEYTFWGWELVLWWCLQFRLIGLIQMPEYVRGYIRQWMKTPLYQNGEAVTAADRSLKLCDLAKEPIDRKFCMNAFRHAIDVRLS